MSIGGLTLAYVAIVDEILQLLAPIFFYVSCKLVSMPVLLMDRLGVLFLRLILL